jgi:hypothetical protein
MRCPLQTDETAGLLLDYSARRLDAASTAALERHMEVCAECRQFGEGQNALWTLLESWEPEETSLDFQRRFWASAAEEDRRRWWNGISWKPAVPVTALCALLLVGTLRTAPAPEPAPVGVEAEHIEQALADLDMLAQLQPPMK